VHQSHGDPLDVEAVLQEEVYQLDVDGEAVDPGDPEDLRCHVATEDLETALCVVDTAGHEGPKDEAGKLGQRCPLYPGALVRRAGERPVAENGVISAHADPLDGEREQVETIGQISVRERPDLAIS